MKKTYALSDLHGYMDLYTQIKEFLKPEDEVIYLGDAIDRGPQSWDLAKAIYNDPQFTYLKGNHEDMLIHAALFYYGEENEWDSSFYLQDLCENGGKETFESMKKDPNGKDFIHKLKNLKEETVYINKEGKEIHLSHAGYTPGKNKKDVLWDRKHILDKLNDVNDNYIIVHGHTPVFFQRNFPYSTETLTKLYPEFYANGHKINIDMGTPATKACVLLDLDTLEYHLFQIKE